MNKIPLKMHGGKFYLASKIIALMPPHIHFVEPFFGGGAVLLSKNPEGISEVANDVNGGLINFWRVLQDGQAFTLFQRKLQATPFSEEEWNRATRRILLQDIDVDHACKFFIFCRQSLAGRMNSFAPLSKTRTRRGMNEQAAAWLSAVEGLPEVHNRLKRVVILNHDALKVIKDQDSEGTLFYCDPTYLPETRSAPDVYEYEMSIKQHEDLWHTLGQCKGKWMLSGYQSKMYEDMASKYAKNLHTFDLPNNSASGKEKKRKIECIWANF